MKLAVTLAAIAATGCATAPEDTAATDSSATIVPTGLPRVTTTCQWTVDGACYGLRNDINNIWPTGLGITRSFVMTRSGPTRLDGKQQTYLAFVVWNDSVVGRIYRLDVGSPDAVNFNSTLGNALYVRTFGPDLGAGQGGATAGTPAPPPHPNVNNPIVFDSPYLDAVVNSASMLDRVTTDFLAIKSAAID